MKYFYTALITAIVLFVGLYIVYNYVPLSAFDPLSYSEPMLGTTITTISGSDTLSASRTTINNNFTALNNGKIETSSTTLPLVTTLANLTTVGTIGTGVWNGTLINVNKGGTGSSTLSQYQVLLGSSTNAVSVVAGLGTSGMALVSNGTGQPPSWQSVATNQNASYVWTALHTFTTAGFLSASSTFTGQVTFMDGITSNTASTTVANDLAVTGSIKTSGFIYGKKEVCSGSTTIAVTAATAGTYGTVTVTCGFQPTAINFSGYAYGQNNGPTSNGFSSGNSYYSHYCTYYASSDGGTIWYHKGSASSSLVLLSNDEAADDQVIYASSTPTATGFVINYFKINEWSSTETFDIYYTAW